MLCSCLCDLFCRNRSLSTMNYVTKLSGSEHLQWLQLFLSFSLSLSCLTAKAKYVAWLMIPHLLLSFFFLFFLVAFDRLLNGQQTISEGKREERKKNREGERSDSPGRRWNTFRSTLAKVQHSPDSLIVRQVLLSYQLISDQLVHF